MVVSENKKMQKGRPPLYYTTSPPPPFPYFRQVNVSVPKWNMESSVCKQFYSISYYCFTQKIKMCWDFLSQVQRRLSGEGDRSQEEFAAARSSVDTAKKFKRSCFCAVLFNAGELESSSKAGQDGGCKINGYGWSYLQNVILVIEKSELFSLQILWLLCSWLLYPG